MRNVQAMALHEVRWMVGQWGYIIYEVAGTNQLRITNDHVGHNEVTHTYRDLDHLKQYLFVYEPGAKTTEELQDLQSDN